MTSTARYQYQLDKVRNYIALRTDLAKQKGDPTDGINRLCDFFSDDAVILTRDGKTYAGKSQIATYLRQPQPSIPSCSAISVNGDVYSFTLTFMFVKAVNVDVRFDNDNDELKIKSIAIKDGGMFDGIVGTITNPFMSNNNGD